MTNKVSAIPVSLSIDTVLERYFGLQQEHRCYPVVDEGQGLIGMVERSSFSTQADGNNPLTTLFTPAHLEQSAGLVALPSETCRIVAARMATHHLERLPVVSDLQSRHLIGIVSRSDLIKPSRLFFDEEQKRERLLR